jgi:hypothetical protein
VFTRIENDRGFVGSENAISNRYNGKLVFLPKEADSESIWCAQCMAEGYCFSIDFLGDMDNSP